MKGMTDYNIPFTILYEALCSAKLRPAPRAAQTTETLVVVELIFTQTSSYKMLS
jgi:hypothetical protein